MRRIRSHLTYANVMATIAVFVVLGGGAYAAFHLPRNSVRSKNIVNRQVKKRDIANGAVSSQKIGEGQVGAGALGDVIERSQESASINPDSAGDAVVQCHDGEQFLSGGLDGNTDAPIVVAASRFEPPNGWRVFAFNEGSGSETITTHVYCLAP